MFNVDTFLFLPGLLGKEQGSAATHLLLHPFGTRAIARDVPLDVIQAQMEHASIQTTSAIYAGTDQKAG